MGFVIGFVVRNGLGLLLGLGFLSAFVAHKAHMEREKHDVEFRCGMSPAGRRPQLLALKLAGSSRYRNIKDWDCRIGIRDVSLTPQPRLGGRNEIHRPLATPAAVLLSLSGRARGTRPALGGRGATAPVGGGSSGGRARGCRAAGWVLLRIPS